MGGNDSATYSGSSADETMTALAFYTFVNTASTVQYFDSFKTLTIAGNGGLDIAVMYDTTGVDTFTASDTSFRYTRSLRCVQQHCERLRPGLRFNYFGGFDTATLNGSSGNDRLTSINNYSVLVTPTTLQQATGFRTVIVNAGSGTDTATLQDSTGQRHTQRLHRHRRVDLFQRPHRPGHRLRHGQRQRHARRTNRRNLASPTYQLKFKGLGSRFGSDQFAFDALARPNRCWKCSRSRSGCTNEAEVEFELHLTLTLRTSTRFGHLNRCVKTEVACGRKTRPA